MGLVICNRAYFKEFLQLRIQWWGQPGPMASAWSASLYGGLGAEPSVGSRGRAPGGGSGGRSPPKTESFLAFGRPILQIFKVWFVGCRLSIWRLGLCPRPSVGLCVESARELRPLTLCAHPNSKLRLWCSCSIGLMHSDFPLYYCRGFAFACQWGMWFPASFPPGRRPTLRLNPARGSGEPCKRVQAEPRCQTGFGPFWA